MLTRSHRTKTLVVGLLLAASARSGLGQAALYTAGDPAAATAVVRGREACGTSTTRMAAIDGSSYESWSASEFAFTTPQIRGSVPNPMGRDTVATTAGRWGVTVVNPGRTALNVTRVEISDDGGIGIFNGINAVQPVTGWGANNFLIAWTGSVDVPPRSAVDFIVQIRGRSRDATSNPITLRATTDAGVLSTTGFVTSQTSDNNSPYVSLPFAVNGTEVFSGTSANGGDLETGATQLFTVRVRESEGGNNLAIPVGTTLTITVPPGFSALAAVSGQAGWGTPTVTEPTDCTAGSIVVATSQTLINNFRNFSFSATAPAYAGGVGLYPFEARLQSSAISPPIDTRTEFTQEVSLAPTTGSRAGITAVEAFLAVPNPMGSNKFTTWGVAVANPLDTPLTVTSLEILMVNGEQFFKAITAVNPAIGWTRPSTSRVLWSGSVTIDPHEARNFIVQIQGNGKNGVDRQVRVTANSTLNKDALTSQNSGNPPAANLYYQAGAQPAVYTYSVASGQPKTFQVVVKETQNVNINAGAVLRVVIPAGWSNVAAATSQTGFTTRTIVQPTATTAGEVRTTTSANFKNSSRTFTFTATAPPNLLESLFVFPTTLNSTQVRSSCDMVVQVVDASGGLDVEHLSPPISQADINQIDIHAVAGAVQDTTFGLSIYNFANAAWEPLASDLLTLAPVTMLSSVTARFDEYFDAPLNDPGKHLKVQMKATSLNNYKLDEDYLAFIVSEYRVLPTDVAPANTFRGATNVAMLALRFETQSGLVDLYTVKVTARGTDPLNDVSQVHLVGDLNCNGMVDPGETDLDTAQILAPDGTVTFGVSPTALLTFAAGAPACAIVAYDIAGSAGAFDVVGAEIAGGFDMSSSVGALYPFPALGGYPIQSSDALIPGGPPSMQLSKSVDPPLTPPATHYPVGTTLTYSIAVSNIGESPSTNVRVSDPLDPAWAPYTGVITPLDGGTLCLPPTCSTAQVTWPAIPSLAGNSTQVVTLRFQATIPNTVPDNTDVPNSAEAVSTEEPTAVSSNLASAPVCAPVLSLVKSLPATPADYAVGEIITWTIRALNSGGCEASNLSVSDVVDVAHLDEATLTFNPPTATWDPVTKTVTWDIASLAPNGQETLQISGTILPSSQGVTLCNRSSATWDQAVAPIASDPPGGSCTSVPVVPPRCSQILSASKSLPTVPADYAEGEPIEWTITVQNNGNCDATGVIVRDVLDTTALDPPYTFVPATGTWDDPTSTYTWPAVTLAGSGTQVLTYRIGGRIKAGTEGRTVCNGATVSFDQGATVGTEPPGGSCTTVPVLPPRCAASTFTPPADLRLNRVGGDLRARWSPTSGAREEHLNQVTARADIPNSRRANVGVGVAVCTGASADCTVSGAIAASPSLIFYQAYAACGPTGADEGPF